MLPHLGRRLGSHAAAVCVAAVLLGCIAGDSRTHEFLIWRGDGAEEIAAFEYDSVRPAQLCFSLEVAGGEPGRMSVEFLDASSLTGQNGYEWISSPGGRQCYPFFMAAGEYVGVVEATGAWEVSIEPQ